MKAVPDPEGHRVRLERQAQEAAYPEQRVGARIRWVAALLAGLVVVSSGVLLATVLPASQPRPAALSSVPLVPATLPLPSSSVSRPPTQAVAPPPTLTTSVSATRSSVAQPPAPVPPRGCPSVRTSTFNDDAAGITYSSAWKANRDRGLGDFEDDVHFVTSNGSSVSFSFNGTGISLVSETFSDEGQMDVFLDGKFQRTVDTTSEARRVQQDVFNACGLQPGFHNIRAVKRSGAYMLVDRFDVSS